MSNCLSDVRGMTQAPSNNHATALGHIVTRVLGRAGRVPLLLYGILCVVSGLGMYLLGVAMVLPRYLLGVNALLLRPSEWLVWYSGMPVVVGFTLALIDLFVLFPGKRRSTAFRYDPILDPMVTVALTAYNDEESIAEAVRDFLDHPLVRNVIVVSNNSTDETFERAQAAGAIAFNETEQGYGHCVYRCLTEAVKMQSSGLVAVCEGDRTFRAYDLEKLAAYAPHADIISGTRTVEGLRQYTTQLSTFMYYGNLFVGKLLEAKHLGSCTITDVGTTYKLCRSVSLHRLLPELDPRINLEFNTHFLDTALREGHLVVECPITFHPRVGTSKCGNTNNRRAFQVGCRMIRGVVFGWRTKGSLS